ncbi:class I SAM-dependent methyltransferase [Nosocomiicoccus massiliensis]|uniref:class I SAM-dependent methyltransferase n=1 Tax=Nosocomiicoccus massiliensis TaxID=1232430 RepID=UPI0003F8E48D|nr:class I SAM-dependent methyltransferase [Nosocomiicoccus massiliensis]
MIITTPLKYDAALREETIELGKKHNIEFVERYKQSVKQLMSRSNDILIIGKEKVQYISKEGTFTYHPNFAQVRLRRILKGEDDPFLEATNLTSTDKFLDCTMGLASDSLIAAYVTDSVTSLESVCSIYLTVSIGLMKYRYTLQQLENAAKRLTTYNIDAYSYLKEQPDNSYDVVYVDPMYDEAVQSEGIHSLKQHANYASLTEDLIEEAKRVAAKRVVLKAHYNSPLFKKFGFMQCIRKNTVSHYGVILTS